MTAAEVSPPTAVSNGHGPPVKVADLPSADPNAQAPAHARAHEETTVTLSERPARPPRTRWISTILTGGSMLHAQPPSLATLWAWHRTCAGHYEAGLISGPRRLWGLMHVACCAVFYGLAWVLTSPPLFFCAAGVVAACVIWA